MVLLHGRIGAPVTSRVNKIKSSPLLQSNIKTYTHMPSWECALGEEAPDALADFLAEFSRNALRC